MGKKLQTDDQRLGKFVVDHVVLRVRSLPESARYYAALLPLLGFVPIQGTRWRDSRGFVVDLQQAESGTADYDQTAPGLNHVGFRATSPSQLEKVQAAMRGAGFAAPEIEWFPGALALFMRDPDGIRFEIGFEEQS
jgi:catechol 2,3-dioxygenase-like lactoylglutathione lyase family enzyme